MMSDSLMKRVLEFQREIEAKKAKPSIECFCYICGGAATGQRIVKASTFYSEGDQLENVVDSLFEDRCDCPRGRFRVSVCPESNREFCPNSRYFKDISQNDMCHYATCESRKGYDQKLILLQDTKVSLSLRVPVFLLTRRSNTYMVAAESGFKMFECSPIMGSVPLMRTPKTCRATHCSLRL
jgi:hypothetical protein